MGQFSGEYSRDPRAVFDELKRYPVGLVQEGIPWVDADDNDYRMANYTSRRRLVQLFGDYGTPNDAFFIIEASSPTNNFEIRGGGGTAETAGRFFMKGHECILADDIDYMDAGATEGERSIHSRITNISYSTDVTTVTDSSANWLTGELVGRDVTLDVTNTTDFGPGGTYHPTVTANTATTFDFADVGGTIYALLSTGIHYRIDLTTPGGSRTDAVYLNVYMDEYDSVDDPTLIHSIGSQSIPAQLRLKTIQNIHVAEDAAAIAHWDGLFGTYTDTDGNAHYLFKLAEYTRADADINTGEITNYAPTLGVSSFGQEDLENLRAIPETVPTDTVYVNSGQSVKTDGKGTVAWIGGSTSPVFGPISANPRWDLVYLKDNSTLGIITGAEAASPVKPDFTDDGLPIAHIYIDELAGPGVIVAAADIVDVRPLFALELRPRLRLDSPNEADSILSTVTVGEEGCDFTTIVAALTYVGTLATDVDRQFSVLVFGKKNGSPWAPANKLIVPSYTHLSGVGKPKLLCSGLAVDFVDLAEGASVKNFYIELADNTWTSGVLFDGDDTSAENITVQFSGSADDTARAFSATSMSRVRITGCTLFASSGGKGCRGILLQSCTHSQVRGCHMVAYEHPLYSAGGSSNIVSDIYGESLRTTTTTGVLGGVQTQDDSVVSNITLEAAVGPTSGFILSGSARCMVATGINVKVAATSDMVALSLDRCVCSGVAVKNGRVDVGTSVTMSTGDIYFPESNTEAAVNMNGSGSKLSNLVIDRVGISAPCVVPGGTGADACTVSMCTCENATDESIENSVAGADDWLLVGNTVSVATATPGVGTGWDIIGEKVI